MCRITAFVRYVHFPSGLSILIGQVLNLVTLPDTDEGCLNFP